MEGGGGKDPARCFLVLETWDWEVEPVAAVQQRPVLRVSPTIITLGTPVLPSE